MTIVCNDCGCVREAWRVMSPLPRCPLCGSSNRACRKQAPEPVETDDSVSVAMNEEVSEEVAVEDGVNGESDVSDENS